MKYSFFLAGTFVATTVGGTVIWLSHSELQARQLGPAQTPPRLERRTGGRTRRGGGGGGGGGRGGRRNRGGGRARDSSHAEPSDQVGGSIQSHDQAGPSGQRQSQASSSQTGNAIPGTDTRASVTVQGPGQIHTLKGRHDSSPIYNVRRGNSKTKQVNDGFSSLAEGSAIGAPPPNAQDQPHSQHPVQASATGQAVDAKVGAPPGGYGHIKLDVAGKPRQEIYVPGGQRVQATEIGYHANAGEITASVSKGGHVVTKGVNLFAASDQGGNNEGRGNP